MLSRETRDLIDLLPTTLQRQVLELVDRAARSGHPLDLVHELEFLLGVQVSDSTFAEWQDTEASFKGVKQR